MYLNLFKKKGNSSLGAIAWKRFKRNHLAMGSLYFIGLLSLISILGYLITPDQTPYANEQILEFTTKKPGFKATILRIKKNETEKSGNFIRKMMYGNKNPYQIIPVYKWCFVGHDLKIEEYTGSSPNNGRITYISLVDVVYALKQQTAPQYTFDSVRFTTINDEQQSSSLQDIKKDILQNNLVRKTYLLGSDRYGRDVLSQLMIGSRVSLSVGFISVLISLVIGIFLGAIAGYFGGKLDDFIVWFFSVIWSIPTLLLVIAITFALGKGFWQVFIAVGLTMWVEVARVVRGQILSIREKEYVEAARALGFSNFRIIFKHILPNVIGPVIVISAANFSSAVLLEAGLSFLGIGVQPPMPSWGIMIRENYGYIILDYAYLAILPGIAIMLVVLAFMLIGNGLRDAMDVRTAER